MTDIAAFSSRLFKIAKIVLALGIMAVVLKQVDPGQIIHHLKRVDWFWFGLALLATLGRVGINAVATIRMLRFLNAARTFRDVFKANFQSAIFSNIHDWVAATVRWGQLSGKDGRRGEAFFLMLAEQIQRLWIISMLMVLMYCISVRSLLRPQETRLLDGFHVIWILAMTIILLSLYSAHVRSVYDRYQAIFFKVPFIAKHLSSRFSDLMRVWQVFLNAWPNNVYVLGFWLAEALFVCLTLALSATSLGAQIEFVAIIWLTSFIIFAQSLPLTIAGLGVREGLLVYFSPRFGLTEEEGLALGILLIVLTVIYYLIGGVWYAADVLRRRSAA